MAPPTPSATAFLTLALIFLLAVAADARINYDFPDYGETDNSDPILILPSDNPAAAGESSAPATGEKKPAAAEDGETVPMTEVRFRPINRHFTIRPINRHFPVRPTTSYRFGTQGGGSRSHRCHHGQTVVRGVRPWTPRYGRIRHLPYGNDAVATFASAAGGKGLVTANDDDRRVAAGDSMAATDNHLPVRWGQSDYYKDKRPVIDLSSNDVVFPSGDEVRKPHHGAGEHQHENLILHKIRKFLYHF